MDVKPNSTPKPLLKNKNSLQESNSSVSSTVKRSQTSSVRRARVTGLQIEVSLKDTLTYGGSVDDGDKSSQQNTPLMFTNSPMNSLPANSQQN